MSNQNLNTLNVETLNFTGSNIYHRGRPIQSFPIDASGAGHGGMLCLDHLGVGPTAPPCPNPLYNLDVSGATRINGALDLSSVDITINAVLTGNIDANLTNSTVGLTSSTLDISGINTTVDISGITTLNNKTIIRGYLDASGLNVHKHFGGPIYDDLGNKGGVNHQVPMSVAGGWEWRDVSGSTINTSLWYPALNTDYIYYDASGHPGLGRVGIDTDTPQAVLDVSGEALIHTLTVGLGGGDISSNTVVGYQALQTNTAGGNNVALGYEALHNNSGGNWNTAVGVNALNQNTDGSRNVAIGLSALYFNKTGYNNVALGCQALNKNTASGNTATGYQALALNETGSNNVATGYKALNLNTDGSGNVATGYNALLSNTTGDHNTATGYNALQYTTDTSWNVATGAWALQQKHWHR